MDRAMAEALFEEFMRTHWGDGVIEGGDGTVVKVYQMCLSIDTAADVCARYGCAPGETAILADWVPAENPTKDDASAVLPAAFKGLRVLYKRGVIPHPLGSR